MWCQSCGTVTRTRECDCTRMETGTQRLVNYADSLQNDIDDLRATEARLRAALTAIERVVWTEGERYQDMLMRCRKLASSACEQKAEDAVPADKR